MPQLPEAFYRRDGDMLVPTELTRGPWDPAAQHGGPPSALLAAELDRRHPRPDVQVVRVTVEILGPVPLTPLVVDSRIERPGRSVELLAATLTAGGRDVLRARAWRIRTTDPGPRPTEPAVSSPPGPAAGHEQPSFDTGGLVGTVAGMDIRFVAGEFASRGPATVWMRMARPLVAGEPIPPLARVLLAADFGNGVSGELDFDRWLFVNPDLTVYLHRLPAGEWVCLDARTALAGNGVGLAESVLWDEHGPLGRSLQSLYVAAR